MEKTIEIPFGAKDSELKGWEYIIPEGMEAEIKDGKIIVREKESEDERIRKELIDFLDDVWHLGKNANFDKYKKADCADWIAWLKKQGSQNLANSAKTCKDEQKPTDNIESSALKDKLLELFQKFRWIKKGVPTNGDIIEYVDAHIQELINTIQNPAWSDEDENCVTGLLTMCCRPWDEWYERLKTFKDRIQPHWKPTTEQLIYLKAAFEKYDFCDSERGALESLYNDIKKL